MTKKQKLTIINLELIIEGQSKIELEGSCHKGTPEMNNANKYYPGRAYQIKYSFRKEK